MGQIQFLGGDYMTGTQFETYLLKFIGKHGYWAHRMAPNESGQQPFDIIAIKGRRILAYDAKVVSVGNTFRFERVEDNQLNAFQKIGKIVDISQDDIGFVILWKDKMYFLKYEEMRRMMRTTSSVRVDTLPWFGGQNID